MDVHASGGIAAVFRRAWITPPTLGAVAFACSIGCGTDQAGVCLSVLHMGPLRDLGLARRDSVTRNAGAQRNEATTCNPRGLGRLGSAVPKQQHSRGGGATSVSEDST